MVRRFSQFHAWNRADQLRAEDKVLLGIAFPK
jgi:hypothetical protein